MHQDGSVKLLMNVQCLGCVCSSHSCTRNQVQCMGGSIKLLMNVQCMGCVCKASHGCPMHGMGLFISFLHEETGQMHEWVC